MGFTCKLTMFNHVQPILGEGKFGKDSKDFGQETKAALSGVMKNKMPLSDNINEMVWKTKTHTHIFGSVVYVLVIKYIKNAYLFLL